MINIFQRSAQIGSGLISNLMEDVVSALDHLPTYSKKTKQQVRVTIEIVQEGDEAYDEDLE